MRVSRGEALDGGQLAQHLERVEVEAVGGQRPAHELDQQTSIVGRSRMDQLHSHRVSSLFVSQPTNTTKARSAVVHHRKAGRLSRSRSSSHVGAVTLTSLATEGPRAAYLAA